MLPIILLGIHTAVKEDLKISAAEIIYGKEIRLPGEFFTNGSRLAYSDFTKRLRENISKIKPVGDQEPDIDRVNHLFIKN